MERIVRLEVKRAVRGKNSVYHSEGDIERVEGGFLVTWSRRENTAPLFQSFVPDGNVIEAVVAPPPKIADATGEEVTAEYADGTVEKAAPKPTKPNPLAAEGINPKLIKRKGRGKKKQ